MKASTAVTIAFLLFSACGAFADDPYGPLFTTPLQREQLDNRFEAKVKPDAVSEGESQAQHEPVLKLNGTLISNTGRKDVWINGRRQSPEDNARVRVIGPDKVQVKSVTAVRTMKPGQILDTASGEVREAYREAAGQPGS